MKKNETQQVESNTQTKRDNEYQSKLSSELSDATRARAWDRVLAAMIRGADPNDPKALYDGNNPVHAAIHDHRSDILDAMLRLGADPNLLKNGELPLDAATTCLSTDAIDVLVKAGADVNKKKRIRSNSFNRNMLALHRRSKY